MNTRAQVLVVEDDAALRRSLCETLGREGYETSAHSDGSAALSYLQDHPAIDLVLSDVQMQPMNGLQLLHNLRNDYPQIPVLLMTAFGSVSHAIEAVKSGAEDYLLKPFACAELVSKVKHLVVHPVLNNIGWQPVAEAKVSRELLKLARRVAVTEATVLINGESGTGKEVIARYIHEQSPRKNAPFIAINCAAIPENMLEAVLFGFEKGAFTGAYKSTPGKFEQAQGGTLLLDEISEMDLGLQAKLLRVLQERELERLGGHQIIDLDVRVLATTNRILREEVAAGRFREDLFYRLNVFPLRLHPLRERPQDLDALIEFLISRHATAPVPQFQAEAVELLRSHSWPGNIRELDNVLQRALILADDNRLTSDHIQFESVPDEEQLSANDLNSKLRDREQDMILDTLRETHGNRKATAEQLGISPRTLRYKLSRMRDAGIAIPA